MLCDTGPLVALLDAGDARHDSARQSALTMPANAWLTSCACITEAMYLLGRVHGHRAQDKLWEQMESGLIVMREIEESNANRMRHFMAKYRDAPMDYADASLVVLAESSGDHQIFTFDQHFYSYLIHDRTPFAVVP